MKALFILLAVMAYNPPTALAQSAYDLANNVTQILEVQHARDVEKEDFGGIHAKLDVIGAHMNEYTILCSDPKVGEGNAILNTKGRQFVSYEFASYDECEKALHALTSNKYRLKVLVSHKDNYSEGNIISVNAVTAR
jgi:hypothetical protein